MPPGFMDTGAPKNWKEISLAWKSIIRARMMGGTGFYAANLGNALARRLNYSSSQSSLGERRDDLSYRAAAFLLSG